MNNRKSCACAQVHELSQSHCSDNEEGTSFSWLHLYYAHLYVYICIHSLLHLMRAIASAHASTRATSLMRVKNSMRHSLRLMTLIIWDIGTKKMKERTKTSNLTVDHFSLTFVSLMLYFHVWLQNKGKCLVCSEY